MRTVGSFGKETLRLVRASAVDLIAEHGFEAMSLRQLASRVGVTAASLYNYIGSKQELLVDLLTEVMRDLLNAVSNQVMTQPNPLAQLQAFVKLHIQFHVDRKNHVLIASTELRSLAPKNRRRIVALRDQYEETLTLIVKTGCDEGLFSVADPKLATLALIPMLTGVCQWYRPGGRLSRQKLIQRFTELCSATLGARQEAHVALNPRPQGAPVLGPQER